MKCIKKGFTLVELLIAISIVAILALIGLVSFRQVLQNSRDSRRLSDIRQIQSALEEYNADQFSYPLNGGSNCANGTFGIGCPLKDSSGKNTYINTLPSDPTGEVPYLYQSLVPPTSYCLYAKMENSQNGNENEQSRCQNESGYNFKATTP